MRTRTVGLLAVVTLLIASCGGGSVEGSGVSDGIGVHGAWTIDIIDPDGTLDQRVEFENALTVEGADLLSRLLTGDVSASGDWTISFGDNPNQLCPSTPGGFCDISTFSSRHDTTADGNVDRVRMSGSTAVEADGLIRIVVTHPGRCDSSTAPVDCSATDSVANFTSAFLPDPGDPDPVPVTAGQTVQIQVEISFGTLP